MSTETGKLQTELADELSSFERQLDSGSSEASLIAEVRRSIQRMLDASGGNEAQVRRVLQDRYDSGKLGKETFQLVKSMLDGYSSGDAGPDEGEATVVLQPADAAGSDPSADEPDPLTSTVVLGNDTAVLEEGSAEARVQAGSVLRDRFLLQERLAGGGMGVVYKALDRRLAEAGDDRPWVAIKVLSPQFAANGHALRALQQEAAKGRCLVHPNIVRFIDFDRDDDLNFIVMEWLEGRTLADILDSADGTAIDSERAFEIVRQVGQALDYAHRCGIVHADVKPGNVMLLPDGKAKLFDFGVARMRQKALEKQPDFDPGVLGLMTPAYSSMQVLGGETPTPADDVFSLACLLYRLLAGYRVFGPRNAAEAADRGMEPQRLQGIPDTQWRAIRKALSYSRVTRYQSMSDFLDALEPDTSEPITISVPAREDLDLPQDGGRSIGRSLVFVVLLLAVAGVAAWQLSLQDFLAEIGLIDAPSGITAVPVAGTPVFREEDTPADGAATPAVAEDGPGAPESAEVPEAESASPQPEAASPEPAVGAGLGAGAGINEDMEMPELESPSPPPSQLVDFSSMPPPTTEMSIRTDGRSVTETSVRLREDGSPVTIDLVREDTEFALTLRLEEIDFSGNRSPWVNGQYSFADNGSVEFPAGQARARITLVMTPDPVREADQQSTLRIREADSSVPEIGLINVTLEDDDQRRFEETLPANTVGFATSQVTVREQDPAVQIDMLRFNPDDTPMSVRYRIRDITATEGEDYFAPPGNVIEFGPGQRAARLLIPLVQDSAFEDNEAFSVELIDAQPAVGMDIYIRTAVMIRDDDN